MVMSDKIFASMGDLRMGKYVIIEDEPCRVVGIQTSKPGKHGAAKMRVEAIGLFDGVKRSLLKPSDADVEIPVLIRKRAQIVSVSGNTAQLMDSESFETFEIAIPEDMKDEMIAGKELQYTETMGKRLLTKVSE